MEMLGKYGVHEKLGQGSFGTVYRAIDTTNGREVALKILHPDSAQDRDLIQGAIREAEQVQKLGDVPGVVKIYEAGTVDGKTVIAMELIHGKPLIVAMSEQRFNTVPNILRLLGELAVVLDAVHKARLVHQDVKPANILIDDNTGRAYLTDFGLAAAARHSSGQFSNSVRNAPGGTPNYMAPETPSSPSPKGAQDIFSLGVLTYELFTGRRPFPDCTFATFANSRAAKVPKPSALSPLVGSKVERELMRAIDLDPARRPKTAGAFVAALKAAAEVEVPKGVAHGRRKPGAGIAVAGIAVLVLVVACAAAIAGILPLPNGIGALIGRATPVATVAGVPVKPLTAGSGTASPTVTAPGQTQSTATDVARPTSAPPSTPTPAPPSSTPRPTATATSIPTATPAPTATRTPVPTPADVQQAVLQGTGVDVQVLSSASGATSGKGRILAQVKDGKGDPVARAFVSLYSQKKDIAGNVIPDQSLNVGYTDSGGSLAFDVEPGSYTVGLNGPGYLWGTARGISGQADVPAQGGRTTQLTYAFGRIEIGMLRADGSVATRQYVQLFRQTKDLAGNWIQEEQVNSLYTESTGLATFDVTPGYYLVSANLPGYSWGNATNVKGEYNVPARPGQTTRQVVRLGQLKVGLLDASGKPVERTYVQVFTLKKDVGGKAIADAEVGSGYTDNTGIAQFDLTAGVYGIRVGQRTLNEVPIESGRVTFSDGATAEVK